ncbi:MAG: hypothetical protein ACI4UE_05695 [Candidatus Scatovivens sp.]
MKLEEQELNINNKKEYTIKELAVIKAIEKIKNPFMNLTTDDVAKDLKLGKNLTYEIFRREDFPSVNIGRTQTVTLLAYLLWKMEKKC